MYVCVCVLLSDTLSYGCSRDEKSMMFLSRSVSNPLILVILLVLIT